MSVDVRTGEIVKHSTADEARSRADRIRENLTVAKTDLIAACRLRDDLALGYDSWQDYCDAEFIEARMIRMDPEQRQEIVATMRQSGMSNHQIASGLGVSRRTVDRDAEVGNVAHLPVKGEDGKTYQPKTDPVAAAIERYPDLDAWRDKPDQLLATASALDGYDEHELPIRLDALAKHASARREGRMPKPEIVDTRPGEIFDHVNAAARLLTGYEDVVLAAAEPLIRDTWRQQYERTGQALLVLAERLADTSLRRVQ